jgi:hypothetical protein
LKNKQAHPHHVVCCGEYLQRKLNCCGRCSTFAKEIFEQRIMPIFKITESSERHHSDSSNGAKNENAWARDGRVIPCRRA